MRRIALFCLLTTALALGSCGDDEDDDLIPEEPVVIDEEKAASDTLQRDREIDSALAAKSMDMTVVVPIHPTSLKYFDYVVSYRDNQGIEYQDTIKESSGGIVVEDWAYQDIEITLLGPEVLYDAVNPEIHSSVLSDYPILRPLVPGRYKVDLEVPEYNEGAAEDAPAQPGFDLSKANSAPENGTCYVKTYYYDNIEVECAVSVEMIPRKGCTSVGEFLFYVPKPYIFPVVHDSGTASQNEDPNSVLEGLECINIAPMTVSSFQMVYGTTFSAQYGTSGEQSNSFDAPHLVSPYLENSDGDASHRDAYDDDPSDIGLQPVMVNDPETWTVTSPTTMDGASGDDMIDIHGRLKPLIENSDDGKDVIYIHGALDPSTISIFGSDGRDTIVVRGGE